MGSGKSTLGRSLAEALEMPFFDLDLEIEKLEHRSIADIIRNAGEDEFRHRERIVLLQLFDTLPCVIACGGGTPCFFDNMEQMKRRGTVVYLFLSPTLLAHRLRNEMAMRPLLHGVQATSLNEHITHHLTEREPFYKQAHITWDAQNGNVQKLKLKLENQSR